MTVKCKHFQSSHESWPTMRMIESSHTCMHITITAHTVTRGTVLRTQATIL